MLYYPGNLGDNETEAEDIFLYQKKELDLTQDYIDLLELYNGFERVKKEIFDSIVLEWNQKIFYILSLFRMARDGNIEIADKFYHLMTKPGINKMNKLNLQNK